MAVTGSPLDGVLVVDLTRHLPGPFATRELLRLGARVVRLEAPGGDPTRFIAPGWHDWLAAGKESVACDLKADPVLGRALCAAADVVVEGFRPGVAERLGIGPGDLPETVVYCSIRGFAEGGPWSDRVGHDVNYLGLAGVLDEAEPSLPPLQVADVAAGGLTAVARVLGGLLLRERTGRGSVHRVSMTDEAHRLVGYRRHGDTVVPAALTGGLACYGLYRAADGAWLTVAALETGFFTRLCELVGHPELAASQYEPAAQATLRSALERVFATRTRVEWLEAFGDEDVAVAPVLALADSIVPVEEPLGTVPSPGRDTEAWRARLAV